MPRYILFVLLLYVAIGCGVRPENETIIEKEWLPIPAGPATGTPTPLPTPQPGFLGRDWFEETLVSSAQNLSSADAVESFYVWNQKFNEGETFDQGRRTQDGITLALNSISTNPQLGTVESVGNTGAVFRVELRDFGQTSLSWRMIEENLQIPVQSETVRGEQLRFLLQKRVPWVYASDFVDTVFKRIYPVLLRQPGVNNLDDFYRGLGVNRAAEIAAERVFCGGLDESTITNQKPRTYCAYEGTFGTIWSTQDIDIGGDNPFENPFPDFSDSRKIFQHDAQEHRYRLPNGLWGHRLNNAERIDGGVIQFEAPTSVVFNTKQAAIGINPAIDYRACHVCHVNGKTLAAEDKLGPRIQQDSNFNGEDKLLGREIFRNAKLQERIALDNQITDTAIQFLGIGPGEDTINANILNPFRLQQNIKQIGAYFFQRPNTFASTIAGTDTASGQVGNLLDENGSIGNEVLIKAFATINDEANIFRD